jgi:large subunit ribosomal protein L6
VKGPKGELAMSLLEDVKVEVKDGTITVAPRHLNKEGRARWGLTRAMANNLVTGVSKGYERKLEISGVGYRAAVQGRNLQLSLGFSHDVSFPVPEGIQVQCPKPTEIVVSGIDKQKVGEVAAKIRKIRPPEPYKGKGVKYAAEKIFRKEGKKK